MHAHSANNERRTVCTHVGNGRLYGKLLSMFSTGIVGQAKLPERSEIKLNGVKAEVVSSGTKKQQQQQMLHKVGRWRWSSRQQAASSKKTFPGRSLKVISVLGASAPRHASPTPFSLLTSAHSRFLAISFAPFKHASRLAASGLGETKNANATEARNSQQLACYSYLCLRLSTLLSCYVWPATSNNNNYNNSNREPQEQQR